MGVVIADMVPCPVCNDFVEGAGNGVYHCNCGHSFKCRTFTVNSRAEYGAEVERFRSFIAEDD